MDCYWNELKKVWNLMDLLQGDISYFEEGVKPGIVEWDPFWGNQTLSSTLSI